MFAAVRRHWRWLALPVAMWLLACVAMYFGQDFLIFPGARPPIGRPAAPGIAIAQVSVAVTPDLALTGWLGRPEGASATDRLPLVIYFGRNAEDVSGTAGNLRHLPGWAWLAVNYRGFGGNPDHPSEAVLCADALKIVDWAAARPDVDPARIAVFGWSLGTGVAVHAASERKLAAVVLVTPYDSIANVAHGRYPWLPTGSLLKHPFDSVQRAAKVSEPALIVIAANDKVVPPERGMALAAHWPGSKRVQVVAGATHSDVLNGNAVWDEISAFLAAHAGKAAAPPLH